MKDGQILKEQLEKQGIKPTEAAKILGRSSRISIYNYFKVDTLKDQTIEDIKEHLGIDIVAIRNEYNRKVYSNVISGNSNVVLFSMEAAISEIYKTKDPVNIVDFRVVSENMHPIIERNSVVRCYEVDYFEMNQNSIYVFFVKSNHILSRYKLKSSGILLMFDNSSDELYYDINEVEKIYAINCVLSFNFNKTIDLITRLSTLESKVDKLVNPNN